LTAENIHLAVKIIGLEWSSKFATYYYLCEFDIELSEPFSSSAKKTKQVNLKKKPEENSINSWGYQVDRMR
jgi:hypothetical protein